MTVAPIRSERLELVSLSPETIDAVLAGPPTALTVPEGWPSEGERQWLRRRAEQMRSSPDLQQWLVRAVVLAGDGRQTIGHAGFHGPPGVNGPGAEDAVEVGYTIFEPYRGRGYATEAAQALMDWARDEHGIRRFIASISPGNEPSLAVARNLGFVQTGKQWDEEDGEELVFQLELLD